MVESTDVIETPHMRRPAGFAGMDAAVIAEVSQVSRRFHGDLADDPHVLTFDQSLKIAHILDDLNLDQTAVVAGLVHDLYGHAEAMQEIKERFGGGIHRLAQDYGALNDLVHQTQVDGNEDAFIAMVFSVAEDLRAVFLFIVNRYFKIMNLDELPGIDRTMLAKKALSWYAPLMHRLGLGRFKSDIENIAFKIHNPDVYAGLAAKLSKRRLRREQVLRQILTRLRDQFAQSGVSPQLEGRTKALLSIYRKMQRTGRRFSQIYDIIAVRAIVNAVPDCYKVLAAALQSYRSIPEEFDDYVQQPKPNGYRSIHALLEDDEGVHFELQIRTAEMHRTAEYGVAAHWKYKEEKKAKEMDVYFKWLREHIDFQGEIGGEAPVTRFFNLDELTTDIFVITPKGDLKRLPRGATPIDFAFSVHRDVGLRCSGAKVNGQIVPFHKELKNGDRVEVLTANRPMVTPSWLTYAHSARARTEIRRWLRKRMREQNMKFGEEILIRGFRKHKIPWRHATLKKLCSEFGLAAVENLYTGVGTGKIGIQSIVQRLDAGGAPRKDAVDEPDAGQIEKRISPEGITVGGMDNLVVHFGKCCMPIPGDPVVGYITRGKGVTVHRITCRNIRQLKLEPEREIEVAWAEKSEQRFFAGIKLLLSKSDDIIKEISPKFGSRKMYLHNYKLYQSGGKEYCTLVVEVGSTGELASIMKALSGMKTVKSVTRLQFWEYNSLVRAAPVALGEK